MLARALFSDVVVMHDGSVPPGSDADAVLIPRVLSITHTRPLFTFQDMQTTMVFEWTMKQRNGDVVWVDTITVSDKATMGGLSAGANARAHVEAMVALLYRRSFEAMASSPQIKEFSVNRRREPPR